MGVTSYEANQIANALATSVPGAAVILPEHPDYKTARLVWNACFDKRPAAIVRCQNTAQVADTVRFARKAGLLLSIRGGGHSLPGFSTNDGGIVLDLSPMREVRVDTDARTATAQGGCTWADYDAATQQHGLASTGGMLSGTGIGGLTLGGGIGWLTRQCGLACDNLLGAEVVTASGEVVWASASEEPDLFWGLRGGGGNFGVVTSFEFRLHPVQQIHGGFLVFPFDRAHEVCRAYREFVVELPDELTTLLSFANAPVDDSFPAELRGQPALFIGGCDLGSPPAAEERLRPLRKLGPAADFYPMTSYTDLQKAFDAEYPAGQRHYFKGGMVAQFTDELIEAIIEHIRVRPSQMSGLDWHHMGGACARVPTESTAFPDRSSAFIYNVLGNWIVGAEDEANRDWARRFALDLERLGGSASYVNFLSEPVAGTRPRAVYGGPKHERLTDVKRRYDPSNLFRLNQNITP
ncbi:MAG: FAD-binding oxidoreductase [Candidatus Dormiibacterota bacterium]